MILTNNINRDIENKTESSCQVQSFSERNFLGALLLNLENKTESSCQVQSFSERNFLGALLLRKETLI